MAPLFQIYLTPEWKTEGIELEQIKRFNILYSINQNKIIIPHYNINNEEYNRTISKNSETH